MSIKIERNFKMLADLLLAGLFLTVGGILRVLGEGSFCCLISILRGVYGALQTSVFLKPPQPSERIFAVFHGK